MDNFIYAAEQVSLFCRLNVNTKHKMPIRSSEMGLLIYLCNTNEEKTPMGAARFFKVSKAMATNMVTALSQKGYLEKKPSLEDKRSSFLMPTEKAKQLVADTYSEYHKTMSILQDKMGSEHFEVLLSLLEQANNILLEEKTNG